MLAESETNDFLDLMCLAVLKALTEQSSKNSSDMHGLTDITEEAPF